MRNDRLHTLAGYLVMAFVAIALPATSYAQVDCNATPCDTIMKTNTKESYQVNLPDLREYLNRGWPVPTGDGQPATSWVPDDGKGVGLTAGGAGGFSYGAVRAPESPPGSRNEDASVSGAAITSSCNFPPRIQLGMPPTISFPAGSCLDFMNNLFKDKNGNTSTATPPVGVAATDTCPADSNNAGLYGIKQTATGTIAAPCGGIVPTATADVTLNANPTDLATTTNGSYYIWTYRKSGASFTPRLVAVPLPSYMCGAVDSRGHPIKTVDLPPPTEQMITYRASDGYIAVKLQGRDVMPATFIPPYVVGAPEQYLILPLNAAGDPVVPPNCSNPATYYKPLTGRQDFIVQSALIGGTVCASIVPTMVNYPTCGSVPAPPNTYKPPGCSPFQTLKDNFIAICNPSNPPPPWLAKIMPVAGKCPADVTDPSCTPAGTTTDTNCDVVTMPIPASAGASCANKVQYLALDRPSLFYPAGTSATFSSIGGRTQLMAATVAGTRYYMQSNTIVTVNATAPTTLLTEGGTLTQKNGDKLIMSAPSTFNPGSGTVNLTNGGQLVSSGGTLISNFSAGATYSVPGGAPYILHVGRSMTLPAGYMVPTVPTVGSQPPYLQFPADVVVP